MNSKEGFTSVQGFTSIGGFNSVEGFNNGGSGLGPELQNNWDMSSGTAGWFTSGNASIAAVNDGGEDAVLITQTGAAPSRANLVATGIEIGKTYQVRFKVRCGANIDVQNVGVFTWGNNTQTFLASSTYEFITAEVTATSANGNHVCNVAASGGTIGDQIYVSEISVREIL